MPRPTYDELFESVPAEQRGLLERFWLDHTYTPRTLAGTPWRYIVMGGGRRTIVLLPHALLPADSWLSLALVLEGHYRLLIPDGYALQSIYEPLRICESVIQMLEAEGAYSATVIAHSAGGSPAQLLLQRWPHRVQHLLLCHSPALAPEVPLTYAGRDRALRLFRTQPLNHHTARGLFPRLPAEGEWSAFAEAYLELCLLAVDRDQLGRTLAAEKLMRTLYRPDPGTLDSWRGSVLYVTARDDPFAGDSLSIYRERYPRLEASAFDAGGHWTHLLYPELFAGRVQRFLSEHSL
ncbi:MAG: alpha/beta hydrolase [Chloroflexi bacterium]|nr:alpha/beta hydrolase [Chloroflexota bacterium]